MGLREDSRYIIDAAIKSALPDMAVRKALSEIALPEGRVILVAIGKAAWQMAKTAGDMLGERLHKGVVITKYHHSGGELKNMVVCEAGHPVPDDNSFKAADLAIAMVGNLKKEDMVLFLISGGGSALFEKPLVKPDEMMDITQQLLKCGADIVEINTIRKRLSAVKGGKFAWLCAPARVCSIVLSDIIGDPLDMIASGPAFPDSSSSEDAVRIAEKYNLSMSPEALRLLREETPKVLENVQTYVTGSVKQLCNSAEKACRELGYEPIVLTSSLCCEAREAGSFFASMAAYRQDSEKSLAVIAGGETVVHVKGSGLGGRNQELALSAALGIDGFKDTAVFSFGSDGTDGPTDAAGGYVDGTTAGRLRSLGIVPRKTLDNNDSYNALKECGGLIMTGPTGTNVNDLTLLLIKR